MRIYFNACFFSLSIQFILHRITKFYYLPTPTSHIIILSTNLVTLSNDSLIIQEGSLFSIKDNLKHGMKRVVITVALSPSNNHKVNHLGQKNKKVLLALEVIRILKKTQVALVLA